MSNQYLTRPIHLENKSKLPKWAALCGSGSRIITGDINNVTCEKCEKMYYEKIKIGGGVKELKEPKD